MSRRAAFSDSRSKVSVRIILPAAHRRPPSLRRARHQPDIDNRHSIGATTMTTSRGRWRAKTKCQR